MTNESAAGLPEIITSERKYMQRQWVEGAIDAQALDLETTPVRIRGTSQQLNPFVAGKAGQEESDGARRMATSDERILRRMAGDGLFPSFLEAGPRPMLRFDPCNVRAAIVAVGGTASGTNAAIHAIVRRHAEYVNAVSEVQDRDSKSAASHVYGILNGFEGLMASRGKAEPASEFMELDPAETTKWRTTGGCFLGLSRYDFSTPGTIEQVARNVIASGIDILYVLGGNGGMSAALRLHHALQDDPAGRNIVVAGVPKTMDNDIAWMWQSLGHPTAVAEAARLLNVLYLDAEANRRVALVELFGPDAGFVTVTSTLLAGRADCVLIPEQHYDPYKVVDFIAARAREQRFALAVLAEGALLGIGRTLETLKAIKLPQPTGVALRDPYYLRQDLRDAALKWLRDELRAHFMKPPVFTGHVMTSQPGYLIRAIPPGAEDLIRAERMGDLVVDSALAGYTGFMLSLWLGYVLIPLQLVTRVRKRVLSRGLVWTEIAEMTRQPALG